MNTGTIVEYLRDFGGYERFQDSVNVADLEFRFDGVLIGPGQEGGLVLVLDAAKHPGSVVLRRVSGFSRVLARTESRRPLAVVLVNSEELAEEIVGAMEDVARTIRIRAGEPLGRSLHRLLPLELPRSPVQTSEAADAALRRRLETSTKDFLPLEILEAAPLGESRVRDLIRKKVRAIATEALGEREL